MTDLREMLDTVAGEPALPTPDILSGDLRRGRTALRRRRGLQGLMALVLAGAALAVGVTVVPDLSDQTAQTVVLPGGSTQPGVPLVPWDDGDATNVLSTTFVPEGWQVSRTATRAVISPPGVTTAADDLAGKLVATAVKHAPTAPANAQHLTAGPQDATIWRAGDTTTLILRNVTGGTLEVLAPATLGWDTATLVAFGQQVVFADGGPTQ